MEPDGPGPLTPAAGPALPDQRERGALPYLEALYRYGAQRLAHAQHVLGDELPELIEARYLQVLHGTLGPVVVPGRLGYLALGVRARDLSTPTATDQVALRDAVRMAVHRGYTVQEVTSRAVRLTDNRGRGHVMYVRVSLGPLSAGTVRDLLRHHRASLQREQGTLILVTLWPKKYALQLHRQARLQVWDLAST